MATYRTTPTVPADVVTYRLGEKLVYVKPAADYEEALDFAQRVFPEELAGVDRSRISFTVSAVSQGERRAIRISEFAWAAVVARLLRAEVIDVHLQSPPGLRIDVPDAPPQYLEATTKESAEHLSRSNPSSRAHSPTSRPNDTERRRSWIGRALS